MPSPMPEDDRNVVRDGCERANPSVRSAPRRSSRRAGVLGLAVAAVVLLATACHPRLVPQLGSDACRTAWGSLPQVERGLSATPMTAVRAGRHQCFDRLVIDVSGPAAAGWDVRYVEQVRTPGRGDAVALRGGAQLQFSVGAPAYAPTRDIVYRPSDPDEVAAVQGYSTLRQVAFLGSYEGRSSFGIGVRARLPFRVVELAGPGAGSRVVVDVAHRWS